VRPAPPAQPMAPGTREDERLRSALVARAGGSAPTGTVATTDIPPPEMAQSIDRDGDGIADRSDRCPDQPESFNGYQDEDGCPDSGRVVLEASGEGKELDKEVANGIDEAGVEEKVVVTGMKRGYRGGSGGKSTMSVGGAMAPPAPEASSYADVTVARRVLSRAPGYYQSYKPPVPTEQIGLAPPPGWRAPTYDPNLPASLAGGWDLSYPSLAPETIASGKGARRVALFSRSWPVVAERKLFPALADEAYLVAEIKNPSKEALPGGRANLFVGADPAGTASIGTVAPGETFTLPLGLDRALKPVRNVKVTTVEKGLINKDEVNEYVVTTEVANPYRSPMALKLYDQIPLAGDRNVEIKLVKSEPAARVDEVKGELAWQVTVPPSGKTAVTFVYTLKRPKGYRLHQ